MARPIYTQADLAEVAEELTGALVHQHLGAVLGTLALDSAGGYVAAAACAIGHSTSVAATLQASAADLAAKTTQLAKPHCLGNFRASSFFSTIDAVDYYPSCVGVMYRMRAVSGGTRHLLRNFTGSTGWSVQLTAAEQIQFRIKNSDGNDVNRSSAVTHTAGDTIHAAVFGYDNTTVWLALDKGTILTVTPATGGYSAPTAADFIVGPSSGAENETIDILGMFLRTTGSVLTQGECDTWFDDCKSASQVVEPAGDAEMLWNVKGRMIDSLPLASWVPDVGAVTLKLDSDGSAGAQRPTCSRIDSPAWAW